MPGKEAKRPHVDARKPWDQKCIIWIILIALERAEWKGAGLETRRPVRRLVYFSRQEKLPLI